MCVLNTEILFKHEIQNNEIQSNAMKFNVRIRMTKKTKKANINLSPYKNLIKRIRKSELITKTILTFSLSLLLRITY